MAEKTKVYGLILPQKKPELTKTKAAQQAFNVFGGESDEDEKPNVRCSLFSQSAGPSNVKRQTQVDIDKALLEDPNVFEYDAVYDEMQASKPKVGAKEKDKGSAEKKPKYIMSLLKAAEQKKKDDEKRKERQVQKEREAEGEKYADKEKFVTSAYKQKMLAMQEEEEKERREAAFEALTDVTKQKDMSGFYRYLYRKTTGSEVTSAGGDGSSVKKEDIESLEVKTEPDASPKQRSHQSSATSSSASESSSDRDVSEMEVVKSKGKSEFLRSNRPASGSNYRKRRAHSTSSDSEGDAEMAKVTKFSHIQKQPLRSRSKSRSPHRNRHDRDHSRRIHSPTHGSKRRTKSRSHSPVRDRKRINRSKSRERVRKDESSRRNKRSESREKSKRSRSRDKSRKNQGSKPKNSVEIVERSRSQSADRKRKDTSSRLPLSEGSSEESKSTDEAKKLQRSRKSEIKEKDKSVEKRHTNQNERSRSSEDEDHSAALEDKRDKSESATDVKPEATAERPAKPSLVDPSKKVYPHRNSPQDVEEARKRYLQRKAAREGAL